MFPYSFGCVRYYTPQSSLRLDNFKVQSIEKYNVGAYILCVVEAYKYCTIVILGTKTYIYIPRHSPYTKHKVVLSSGAWDPAGAENKLLIH